MSDKYPVALHKAKLMVLKVHQLAKQARAERCRLQTHALCERAIAHLSPPSGIKEVHRVIFYHLMHAATANHITDADRDLRAVERICKLHELDYHRLYQQMTYGVQHPSEHWMGLQDVAYGFDFAALAIDFELDNVSPEDDHFFRNVTFDEIVGIHDSYDDYQAKFRLPLPARNTDPK